MSSMIDILLNGWPYLLLLAIGGLLGLSNKTKSVKIDKQVDEIKTLQANLAKVDEALSVQKESIKVMEKTNEILNQRTNLDDAVTRLRERSRKNRDGNKDKL